MGAEPPVVPIGITLEDDGWWLYCPVCDEAFGPYADRGKASHRRGIHLISVHGGINFSPTNAARAARKTRARQAAGGLYHPKTAES